VLKEPFRNSFQHRADQALSDGTTDFDALALNESAIAGSAVNFFGGDPLIDLAPTSLGCAPGSTMQAKAWSGNTGSASIPLQVGTALPVTVADGASVEIDGASAP
jgi:hypothetical protein